MDSSSTPPPPPLPPADYTSGGQQQHYMFSSYNNNSTPEYYDRYGDLVLKKNRTDDCDKEKNRHFYNYFSSGTSNNMIIDHSYAPKKIPLTHSQEQCFQVVHD